MKVTRKMLDKQMRFKGILLDLLVTKKSEEKFIESMHNSRKQMKNLYVDKNMKGLDCSEVLVSRKDGSAPGRDDCVF
ncbi:hypothetical protein [Planomicrobium sp. Y74]|uniref:hypothetical protein n=1 Tax=Planomicrobium sp. Y74 TaxID=2478977 RepID=UPI000EF4CBAB|nr:hypothetical protein [Planomicrobium sp. Y74]RLQ91439.1 hypothetical protein D9754_06840 [Planomicrobium sp. Y74]